MSTLLHLHVRPRAYRDYSRFGHTTVVRSRVRLHVRLRVRLRMRVRVRLRAKSDHFERQRRTMFVFACVYACVHVQKVITFDGRRMDNVR